MEKTKILSREQINSILTRYDSLKSEINKITAGKDAEELFQSRELKQFIAKQKSIEDLLLGNYGSRIVQCFGSLSDFNAEYSESKFRSIIPNAFAEFKEYSSSKVTLTKFKNNSWIISNASNRRQDPVKANETFLIYGVVGIANTKEINGTTYIGTPIVRR